MTQCLVFEDAPAGIAAGSAAGAAVVVITEAHAHSVETEFPRLRDYRGLTSRYHDAQVTLEPLTPAR